MIPRTTLSLRRQLSLGLFVAAFMLLASMAVFFPKQTEQLVTNVIATRLQHDSQLLLASLIIEPGNPLKLDTRRLPDIFLRPFSGHYFIIRQAGQTLRSRSLWDEQWPELPVGLHRDIPGPRGQSLLILSQSRKHHGQSFHLEIAEDLSIMKSSIRSANRQIIIFGLLMLVVLLLAQRQIVNRALKSLEPVRIQLREIHAGQRQSIEAPTPKEIQPLVEEINTMAKAMEQRLQRSRNALGNLAHSLKTPLAQLIQEVHAARELSESRQKKILSVIERLNRKIHHELTRARMAGEHRIAPWLYPERDIRALILGLEKMYREKPVSIQAEISLPEALPIDQEDILEMIGNLLDNACKWARHKVIVKIHVQEGKLQITVGDDGPGFDPDLITRFPTRGLRSDSSPSGHGIGLHVVAELAELYHGTVKLNNRSPAGGAQVSANIPLHFPDVP